MPSYATTDDLTALAIPAEAIADLDPAIVTQALASASDDADSYLRNKFTLPLTAWGQDLRKAVCRIAAYSLLSSRGFNPQASNSDRLIADNNEKAIAWLRDVGKGLATPSVTDSSPTGLPSVPSAVRTEPRGWYS